MTPAPPEDSLPPGQPPAGGSPPERVPFWSYIDLLIFAGLAIPCMLIGLGIVKGFFLVLHLHPAVKTWQLVLAQFIGYGLLFGVLVALFRTQYDRPFWRSLAWTTPSLPVVWIVVAGMLAAIAVSLIGTLMRVPTKENPLTDLLKDPASLVLVAVFGITAGPLCEELAFRGFLQPLLVRSVGVIPGVLAAAILFGLLHFQEYGNSWRHAVIISLAGALFGWMRQVTGSTKASTIMHAAYNALFFFALFSAKGAGK
jgi:membrane protease YdiL (CAAX protease family)